jgi:hypothetical protein
VEVNIMLQPVLASGMIFLCTMALVLTSGRKCDCCNVKMNEN